MEAAVPDEGRETNLQRETRAAQTAKNNHGRDELRNAIVLRAWKSTLIHYKLQLTFRVWEKESLDSEKPSFKLLNFPKQEFSTDKLTCIKHQPSRENRLVLLLRQLQINIF